MKRRLAVVVIAALLVGAAVIPVEEPSYNEVKLFLEQDLTDQIPYEPVKMVCWDFAEILQENAHKAGLACSIVTLAWGTGDRSHVINAFETSDRGLIWVDCTGSHDPDVKGYDRELEPKVAGDRFVYQEIGGVSPVTVTLTKVTYK